MHGSNLDWYTVALKKWDCSIENAWKCNTKLNNPTVYIRGWICSILPQCLWTWWPPKATRLWATQATPIKPILLAAFERCPECWRSAERSARAWLDSVCGFSVKRATLLKTGTVIQLVIIWLETAAVTSQHLRVQNIQEISPNSGGLTALQLLGWLVQLSLDPSNKAPAASLTPCKVQLSLASAVCFHPWWVVAYGGWAVTESSSRLVQRAGGPKKTQVDWWGGVQCMI